MEPISRRFRTVCPAPLNLGDLGILAKGPADLLPGQPGPGDSTLSLRGLEWWVVFMVTKAWDNGLGMQDYRTFRRAAVHAETRSASLRHLCLGTISCPGPPSRGASLVSPARTNQASSP